MSAKLQAVPAGRGANPCCCDPEPPCHIISAAFCYNGGLGCGFEEFTVEGEEPSCPPKRYAKKTIVYKVDVQRQLIYPDHVSPYGTRGSVTVTCRMEGDPCTETRSACDGLIELYGENDEVGSWTYPLIGCGIDPQDTGHPAFPPCHGVTDITCNPYFSAPSSKTSLSCTYNNPGIDDLVNTSSTSITLSEEVSPQLSDNCNEVPCNAALGEPDCQPCCTDRGGEFIAGAVTPPYLSQDCLYPWDTNVAFDYSLCETNQYRGRFVGNYLWFRDLTPGQAYRATIYFKLCPMATTDDNGDPLDFNCKMDFFSNLCQNEPEEMEDRSEFIEFTATDWAEILGDDKDCRVRLIRCQLEDEANIYNEQKAPEDPAHSVGLQTGQIVSPRKNNYLTFIVGCSLEAIATPP